MQTSVTHLRVKIKGEWGSLIQAEDRQRRKNPNHYIQNFFVGNFKRQYWNCHLYQPSFIGHKMDLPAIFPCNSLWEQSPQQNTMLYHSACFLWTYMFTSQTAKLILPLPLVIRICHNATLLIFLTNHWVYWAKGTTLTTLLW